MNLLPVEILNLILFEYIDDIDYRIYFSKIGKINLNYFQNLENMLKETCRSFSLFNVSENGIFYSYRYIRINYSKYYRITHEYIENYNSIQVTIEICDFSNPMYESLIAVLFY
tara:strand:- start:26 stop:364 length:339 start_codon:yes stop_codon:yes gene_type:complete